MVFGEIESAVALYERVARFFAARKRKASASHESVASRFKHLFEAHGVHRNQIPRFFGHGLNLADMSKDDALIAKLTEEILSAACELFAVRREWLDGASDEVYPCHDFYKNPQDFISFLDDLIAREPTGRLGGFLLSAEETRYPEAALLVLIEPIGSIGEREIFRYHLCNNWRFSYWKARAYLTACIAIAWKRKVHVLGKKLPARHIESLVDCRSLIEWHRDGGGYGPGGALWYPEDMCIKPDLYLAGIDPERNQFGMKAALGLWLELDNAGFMDIGVGESHRNGFEYRLAELK